MKNEFVFASGVALGVVGCIALTNKLPCKKRIVGGKRHLVGGSKLVEFTYDGTQTEFPEEPFYMIVADNVTSIKSGDFSNSLFLTSITISYSVKKIQEGIFSECVSLTTILVDDKNQFFSSIDGVLFNKDKTSLLSYPCGKKNQDYKIPSSVTNVGDFAFIYCTSLTTVDIPSSVTSIGETSFGGCSSLTSIMIPSSVTIIRDYAFSECASLRTIVVDENNKNFSSDYGILFNKDKTKLLSYPGGINSKRYDLPSDVKNIGNGAFYGCTSLTRLDIPNDSKLKTIDPGAFQECSSLKSFYIPSNVKLKSIGSNAFLNCSSLDYIQLPNTLKSIGLGSFYGCSSLININIPYAIKIIEDYSFTNCTSLRTVTIPDDSQLTSIGSSAFQSCPLTTFTIPNLVTSIGSGAFNNCLLTTISIGNSVTTIGETTFYNCTSLTTITIPDSVTSIGSKAFFYCTSLTTINISSDSQLKTIGDYAFLNCSSLTTFDIPNGTTFGIGVFDGCKSTFTKGGSKRGIKCKNV